MDFLSKFHSKIDLSNKMLYLNDLEVPLHTCAQLVQKGNHIAQVTYPLNLNLTTAKLPETLLNNLAKLPDDQRTQAHALLNRFANLFDMC